MSRADQRAPFQLVALLPAALKVDGMRITHARAADLLTNLPQSGRRGDLLKVVTSWAVELEGPAAARASASWRLPASPACEGAL